MAAKLAVHLAQVSQVEQVPWACGCVSARRSDVTLFGRVPGVYEQIFERYYGSKWYPGDRQATV
jgi:hypothetical protein